jgi:hypothetical protein
MDLLDPIDLTERIRLGQNALLGGLDPSQGYMPYWNSRCEDGKLVAFRHAGAWDWCHDVARGIHALGMAEQATGDPVPEEVWSALADLQIGLFADDDLPGCPDDKTGERFVHLHNIREAAHALAALIRKGDSRADDKARRMVRKVLAAVDEEGVIDLGALPPHISDYTYQPHQEGRAVDALVRLFRVNGDEAALDLAERMTRFALAHCFTEAGSLREEASNHGHSINAMAAGMADLALLTGDADRLVRVKAIYDVGLPRFHSSFGWSQEALNRYNLRGESNNTGDLLRLALLLGACGWASCYEDAERILRSHLLPSQVVDVADLPDDEHAEDAWSRRASRLRGGFSFPTPNDLLVDGNSPLTTYDIISGAVDGLCEARRALATCRDGVPRVHLLFSGEAAGLIVESDLSAAGTVRLQGEGGVRSAMVRLPSWANPKETKVTVGGDEVPLRVYGGYAFIPMDSTGSAQVTFPMAQKRTQESICYQRFDINWRGDQITAMSPAAENRPMFPPLEI